MKNMTCEDAREKLSYYLDETLEADERHAFEQHLEACGDCRREADELSQIIGILNDLPEAPVPDRFELNFKRALREEIAQQGIAPQKIVKKPRWKAMSAVAAVMVVGVLSVAMLQDGLKFTTGGGASEESAGGGTPQPAMLSAEPLETGNVSDSALIAEHTEQDTKDNDNLADAGAVSKDIALDEPTLYGSRERTAPEPESSAYGAAPDSGAAGGQEDQKQAASVPAMDGTLSRGAGIYSTKAAYDAACEEWITQYVAAINARDIALFEDCIEKGGKNGYTTDTAEETLKLYGDVLGEGAVTYSQIQNNSAKMVSGYRIDGAQNSLRLILRTTSSGLEVREAILDHGGWLQTQLNGSEFSLDSYQVADHGKQVTFKVKLQLEEITGAAMDVNPEEQQVKEVIWKKTE